ncbi:MFS transporter [Virgisporangium aliadipatigenens]|uniref:MFS transporter n=1 Tax=Virgisporangium aliadipatigenens TaxID=741659 RepID=A0A8J3YNB5_9ACTN|nr:MFS transporter [Virgisporangium aliadipatigenens]GIJ47582.1 MFS transporter [Virgisporangium aliadipatigenens]
MRLAPYRSVLRLPGVRSLMILALIARIPASAVFMALTLHVVLGLGESYARAGVVSGVLTITSALGGPLIGRLLDRTSLRFALAIGVTAELAFWMTAPSLPYHALVVAAGLLGLVSLPVFSVVRQSIAALVPEAHRKPAYALDSMSVELSFMVGPAAAVVLATTTSSTVMMYAVGAAMVLAGAAFYVADPPIRAADEEHTVAERVPRRSWMTFRFGSYLIISVATTAVLAGSDLAIVATLRANGEVSLVGFVVAGWAAYSLLGGFLFGALRRTPPPVVLVALLGAFTIPVGLATGAWWLAVALIPAGLLCAPTLAATADAVSRLVPAAARGEAMGWHNSSITLGLAVGSPLAGAVIDASAPGWAFVVAGGLSLGTALALMPFMGVREPRPDAPAEEKTAVPAAL